MEKLAKQLEKKLDLANVLKIKEKTDNELEHRLKYCTQGSTHQNQLVLEPSWRRTKKNSNPSGARIPDCTFCKIVSPDEHNQIIFQNELLVIFDDIKKIKNVNHLLAVPKNHIKDINKAGFLKISEPRKRPTCCMTSVKPFKSKNRDNIDLIAPNLKKGSVRDFRATA